MKKVIVFCFSLITAFCYADVQPEEIIVNGVIDLGRASIVDFKGPARGAVYIATEYGVYRSAGADREWSELFRVPENGANRIQCIAVKGDRIFVGTKSGLFRNTTDGTAGERVLSSVFPSRRDIICVELDRDKAGRVFAGTPGGLFRSDDDGNSWSRISKKYSSRVASSKGRVYAILNGGFYVNGGDGWEEILTERYRAEDEDAETADQDREAGEENIPAVRCFTIADGFLYVSMEDTVLVSKEGTGEWTALESEGISGGISDILASDHDKSLFAATTKGVYEYPREDSRWRSLTGEAPAFEVNKIGFKDGSRATLWAATNRGLFALKRPAPDSAGTITAEKREKDLSALFEREPTFIELERAAIRYNEVSAEKIKNFRRDARLRAFFPKISIGLDAGRSNNIEFYKSSTSHYVLSGPDDLSEGWDLSVSWDLGDLVYSAAQTNIDARSRLMVQSRDAILDDLRGAFYRRRRLLFDMATRPPKDQRIRFEKEIRIQELTSEIDGLTGDYLSWWLSRQSPDTSRQ
ncbi:MAG: hypothetical protein ABIJ27_03740 [Candidatus Omnitrophota bacterium]